MQIIIIIICGDCHCVMLQFIHHQRTKSSDTHSTTFLFFYHKIEYSNIASNILFCGHLCRLLTFICSFHSNQHFFLYSLHLIGVIIFFSWYHFNSVLWFDYIFFFFLFIDPSFRFTKKIIYEKWKCRTKSIAYKIYFDQCTFGLLFSIDTTRMGKKKCFNN